MKYLLDTCVISEMIKPKPDISLSFSRVNMSDDVHLRQVNPLSGFISTNIILEILIYTLIISSVVLLLTQIQQIPHLLYLPVMAMIGRVVLMNSVSPILLFLQAG